MKKREAVWILGMGGLDAVTLDLGSHSGMVR